MVSSVHQLTDEVFNQLLIDFIHKLDLWHGIEEELQVFFVVGAGVRRKVFELAVPQEAIMCI